LRLILILITSQMSMHWCRDCFVVWTNLDAIPRNSQHVTHNYDTTVICWLLIVCWYRMAHPVGCPCTDAESAWLYGQTWTPFSKHHNININNKMSRWCSTWDGLSSRVSMHWCRECLVVWTNLDVISRTSQLVTPPSPIIMVKLYMYAIFYRKLYNKEGIMLLLCCCCYCCYCHTKYDDVFFSSFNMFVD